MISDDKLLELKVAMASQNLKVLAPDEEKRISVKDLENMPSKELLGCKVIIKDNPVYFWEGLIASDYRKAPLKYGIGFHYLNMGASAGKETHETTALDMVASAFNMSKCRVPGNGWAI